MAHTDLINEEELYSLIYSDRGKAFTKIYERYSAAIFAHLCGLSKNREQAEDILQETFVKVWKNMEQYQPDKGRIFTWLYRIAKNTATDYFRKKNPAETSKLEVVNVHTGYENQNIEDVGLAKEISKLNAEQQVIIKKLVFEGYTQQEVSEKYGIPLGTVKSRYRLAIKNLRRQLGGEASLALLMIINYLIK